MSVLVAMLVSILMSALLIATSNSASETSSNWPVNAVSVDSDLNIDPPTIPNTTQTEVEDTFNSAVFRGSQLGAPPSSLEGTDIDGSLKIDSQGNLILDSGLRQLFDYFLATIGEESLADISARLALHIEQNLNPTAAQQAWHVFERYLQYKQLLENVQEHDGSLQGMTESMKQQQALRTSILGPELATAFYQEEDDFTLFNLGTLEIMNDPTIDSQQKLLLVEGLLAALPEQSREAIQPQINPLDIEDNVGKLQEDGASESEIWQFRERNLGAEAADRLALLDQRRQHWAQQYAEYRNQYQIIKQNVTSPTDFSEAIDALRSRYFNASELKRVTIMDKQHDGS